MAKKTAAIFMAVLLLVFFGALADSVGVLGNNEITIVPPEGYRVVSQAAEGLLRADITCDDPNAVHFSLSVAMSEQFAGYTLQVDGLSSDEYEQMVEMLTADFDSPEIQFLKAEDGSDVIFVDEQGSASDYAFLFTIYNGYIAELAMFKTSGQITGEDLQLARDMLSSTRNELVTQDEPLSNG